MANNSNTQRGFLIPFVAANMTTHFLTFQVPVLVFNRINIPVFLPAVLILLSLRSHHQLNSSSRPQVVIQTQIHDILQMVRRLVLPQAGVREAAF